VVHLIFADRAGPLLGRLPLIMDGEEEYDANVTRFLRDLPHYGVRSGHSIRAYAYDVCVWARFLRDGFGVHVWNAQYEHVKAYHRERRDGSAAGHPTGANACGDDLELDRGLIEGRRSQFQQCIFGFAGVSLRFFVGPNSPGPALSERRHRAGQTIQRSVGASVIFAIGNVANCDDRTGD